MLILFIILTMVFSSYVIKTSTAEFEEQIDVQLRGITTQIDNTLRLADDIALQIAANYQIIDAFSGLQEYHDEKNYFVENTDVDYTIKQQKAQYDEKFTNLTSSPAGSQSASYDSKDDKYDDPLYNEVVDFVIKSGKTSASLLQRKYRLGYNRAARMIDLLEERGIVGPPNGSKPREVLVKYENNDEEEQTDD